MAAESEARKEGGCATAKPPRRLRWHGDGAIGIIVGILAAGLLWFLGWLFYVFLLR